MLKWFFLICIVFICIAANGAVLTGQYSLDAFLFSVTSLNLFALSLLLIWLSAYFRNFKNAGYLVYGHALLMLSAGIGLIGLGTHSALSGSCRFLIQDRRMPGLISRLAAWAMENHACSLLSLTLVGIGAFLMWPSLKLFFSMTCRSIGTR
jgi:hypothetical protein